MGIRDSFFSSSGMANDDIDSPDYGKPADEVTPPTTDQAKPTPRKAKTTRTPVEVSAPGLAGDLVAVGDLPAVGEIVDHQAELKELGKKIRSARRRLERVSQQAIESVLMLGEYLTDARRLLSEPKTGSYGKYLEQLGISRSLAQRCVTVYERFGNCASVTQNGFDLSACYALAKPSVPIEAVNDALERAEQGERVDTKAARVLISKHTTRKEKPAKPEKIVLELARGYVTLQPASNDTDLVGLLRDALEALKVRRAA